jgi:hypothetical protein
LQDGDLVVKPTFKLADPTNESAVKGMIAMAEV